MSGTTWLNQQVIENKGIEALEHLLNSTTKTIRKEAMWSLSNITAGNENQIAAVIGRPSLLDKLLTLITNDVEEVRKKLLTVE